ncbi:hypothetical protein [uncultured Shewanella sp.]|uniref:RHS repeat domain-containing protein n=1 Tax=uncultured Shewanella sp. TaxID=173975 RepID=UPI0026137E2D|nr:hypothetical protein [uncultured Shewanella sp.]
MKLLFNLDLSNSRPRSRRLKGVSASESTYVSKSVVKSVAHSVVASVNHVVKRLVNKLNLVCKPFCYLSLLLSISVITLSLPVQANDDDFGFEEYDLVEEDLVEEDDEHAELAQDYFHVLMDAMSNEDRQAFELDLAQHQQKMLSRYQCKTSGIKCHSKMAEDESNDDDLMSRIPKASDAFKQLDTGLFGELIDLNTGTVTFNQTDFVAKGNGPDIKISRTLSDQSNPNMNGNLGDWILDIPRIKTTLYLNEYKGKSVPTYVGHYKGAWAIGKACSGEIAPGKYNKNSRYKKGKKDITALYLGDTLELAGNESSLLLQTSSDSFPRVTQSNWRFSCTNIINNTGLKNTSEGFVGHAPDGTKYTFNQLKTARPNLPQSRLTLNAYLYVTKIEDRFGNTISYHYNKDNQLTKITASDKREITFSYHNNSNDIKTISYDHKKWSYAYSDYSKKHKGKGYAKFRRLKKVTRPDNKAWEYQFNDSAYLHPLGVSRKKKKQNDTLVLNVSHPDGAKGEFNFKKHNMTRTNVADINVILWKEEVDGDEDEDSEITDKPHKVSSPKLSIYKKSITNPLGTNLVWKYEYSKNAGAWYGQSAKTIHKLTDDLPSNIGNFHYKWTKVTEPDGSKTQYYYNRNGNDPLEGQLMASRVYQDNQLLEETQYTYKRSDKPLGHSGVWLDNWKSRDYRIMRTKKHINRQNEGDTYNTAYSDFNAYGVPRLVTESNNISTAKRYTKTTYQHNINKWVLNLPLEEYVSSSNSFDVPVKKTVYSITQLLPSAIYEHGELKQARTYSKAGQLQAIYYNGNMRIDQFKDYYRGIPRKIIFPCATKNACSKANGSSTDTMVTKIEVNNDATIKSITDFKGHKTSYEYNAIGWMTKINHHNKAWADESISYAKVKNEGDGNDLGALVQEGQLKQTKQQGSLKQITYFDSLLRPYLFVKQDTKNKLTTYERKQYDHNNQVILETNQANTLDALVQTKTDYDALGRVIKITRLNDKTETNIDYLNGNKKQVSDPNNNVITTSYLAYGEPEQEYITAIAAPESTNTSIKYNIHGNITSIKQGNVTEKRVYDGRQNVCKVVRPETGMTAFGYNKQNLPIWRAEGISGSETACNTTVPAQNKVTLAYDNLDQLKSETYPVNKANQTPNITYAYDENSNLTKIAAGKVTWNYGYNVMDKVTSEKLQVDKKTFNIAWGYNNLGNVSSLTYPSGKKITFAPNAFGQATQAGIYATKALYHGNGQVKSFTYGNGISRSIGLDTSSRINKMQDSHTTNKARLKLTLAYDDNDNLSKIIDGIDDKNSVKNIQYDGLNRLIKADGKWGKGQFTYDTVGNIKSRSVSGSKINYVYDGHNRLKSISGAYKYGYKYDARGNTLNNGRFGLSYNRANQLTSAKGHTFVYDGHGRRVKDTHHNASEFSIYSQNGQLLHRQNAVGDKIDSIYLGNQLIADVESR